LVLIQFEDKQNNLFWYNMSFYLFWVIDTYLLYILYESHVVLVNLKSFVYVALDVVELVILGK